MKSDQLADFIAEELLEQTGAAILKPDFDAFKQHFELPLRLETLDGHRFVGTEDEFRNVFDAIVEHRSNSGVEDFVRTVIFAEFVDPETIRSVHLSSEIHGDGKQTHPAYRVHSTLVKRGDSWKIVTCHYVIHDNPPLSRVFLDGS